MDSGSEHLPTYQRAAKLPATVSVERSAGMLRQRTMRELGKVFQLSLTPSWSSMSLHCSFSAS